MKQGKNESDERVSIGPATLYGAIKKLLADRWIEEAGIKELLEKRHERRKYYRLTEFGRKQLITELKNMKMH